MLLLYRPPIHAATDLPDCCWSERACEETDSASSMQLQQQAMCVVQQVSVLDCDVTASASGCLHWLDHWNRVLQPHELDAQKEHEKQEQQKTTTKTRQTQPQMQQQMQQTRQVLKQQQQQQQQKQKRKRKQELPSTLPVAAVAAAVVEVALLVRRVNACTVRLCCIGLSGCLDRSACVTPDVRSCTAAVCRDEDKTYDCAN